MPARRWQTTSVALIRCTLLATLTLTTAGAPTRPPSSLEPEPGSQDVRVSHQHSRVRSCSNPKGARSSCVVNTEPGEAATRVTFHATARPVSTTKQAADTVSVDLPSGLGSQSRSVRLHVGRWLIDWPECPTVAYVDVSGSEMSLVELNTVTGRCEMRNGKCLLRPRVESKRIRVVTADRRANDTRSHVAHANAKK